MDPDDLTYERLRATHPESAEALRRLARDIEERARRMRPFTHLAPAVEAPTYAERGTTVHVITTLEA